MTIEIDKAKAIELLTECVAERGENYIYELDNGMCNYVRDNAPSCLVGLALFKGGATVEQLKALDADPSSNGIDLVELPDGLSLSQDARGLFCLAQDRQDGGDTWGAALEIAKSFK